MRASPEYQFQQRHSGSQLAPMERGPWRAHPRSSGPQRATVPVEGATPTRAAICRRSRVPSSGRYARRVREICSPTPGTVRRRSSFSRHTGRRVRRRPPGRPTPAPATQCGPQRGDGGDDGGAETVLLRVVTWCLRATRELRTCVSASRKGRTGGRMTSAKWARTAASSESVLASPPGGPGKVPHLAGVGQTTGNWSPELLQGAVPDASSNTMTGSRVFSWETSCRTPASSWETSHLSP